MSGELRRGLEGVLIAESKLSFIDGDAGQLVYYGYDIEDLTRDASYEEVLYLLWHGALPTGEELDAFSDELAAYRNLDDGVLDVACELAEQDESPMATLQTLVSAVSAHDESADFEDVTDREVDLEKTERTTTKMPSMLAAYARFRRGDDYVKPDENLNHVANFPYMLNGEEPNEVLAETFDMVFVLHADHGLNASTFSVMVTSSTLSDLYSVVTSAIGTLSGSLHGGANTNIMWILKSVDGSDMDPAEWVKDALDRDERVAGFGHRVYNVKDPRAKILGAKSEALGETVGDMKWCEISVAIEEYIDEEEGLAPNVDFYSASMYYQMGIPIDLYTLTFAVSRAGGWIARVLEQYGDNRLIRPRARYTGEKDFDFMPVDER